MRSAKEVIDQAISENRLPEYLLYIFATLFVLTGEVLIALAIHGKSGLTAIAGVALNGLAWPAYRATRDIRSQNLMLRMLEVPLSKAKSAKEAAEMLTDSFRSHFQVKSSDRKTERPGPEGALKSQRS
jgi:hypothetical protein